MKQRTRYLSIGSVSHGTLRDEDLIPAFLDEAERLRLSKDERAKVRAIRARYNAAEDDSEYWQEDASEDTQELFDVLDAHCPDYCYFGATEGDGSDFGCWPVSEVFENYRQGGYDGCIYRCTEKFELPGSQVPAEYSHFLSVTDHGNCTLYRRSGRRWLEVWAVV